MDCTVSHTPRFPYFFSSWWSGRRSLPMPVSASTQTSPTVMAPPLLPSPPPEPVPEMDPETAGREAIEDLDSLVGLENVKRYLHGVQTWVQICRRHGRDPRGEWYNIALQGNPGTGKTTIARIYARLLYAMRITTSENITEITGTELASTRLSAVLELDETSSITSSPPSVLIIDHPYQIKPGHPVLDDLMEAMEQHMDRIIVIFTGDTDEMDNWLRAQPRLRRLTCSSVRFADFDRDELLQLLARHVSQQYQGRMQVEGGLDGQYMAVAARRLARGHGVKGFLNVYAVRDFVTSVARRQAEFLTEQQDQGMEEVDYYFFSKEDVLGQRPTEIREQSEAWMTLQKLIGQDAVKASVRQVCDMAEENYWREVQGQKRLVIRLNRVFVGPSGTGKTTAARLYAQILADLGLVRGSNVGYNHISDLDVQTLESSMDRVLVVNVDDETPNVPPTVLDALTDRLLLPQEYGCMVLLGTEKAMDKLLSHTQARSKSAQLVVHFQGFTSEDMKELVERNLAEQGVEATPEALQAALEILEHARLRKDFDHARAIDHLIIAAQRNFTARQTVPIGRETTRVLEAEDFSLELVNVRSALSFRDELRHTIVPDDIISTLKRYHTELRAAWMMGRNPAGQVPSAFVFKGATGTGKKTVARQLGALYYRMGVLSSEVVVDCSISDLIPQRGAKEQFEKSRGQVLFISDAHRLIEPEITPRVLDELVYLIPRHEDQTVVILAGPVPEMDQLLSNRPRLASLFQEEIVFRNPTPRECLRLLDRRLEERGILGTRAYLTDPRTPSHREFTRGIQILSMFPCWSNAKDIDVLVRWMVSTVLKETPLEGSALAEMQLTEEQAMACMVKLYNLKRDRLRFNQDPKARSLPRMLSQPRCTDRTGVKFPV